jgi:hypothetical protein
MPARDSGGRSQTAPTVFPSHPNLQDPQTSQTSLHLGYKPGTQYLTSCYSSMQCCLCQSLGISKIVDADRLAHCVVNGAHMNRLFSQPFHPSSSRRPSQQGPAEPEGSSGVDIYL